MEAVVATAVAAMETRRLRLTPPMILKAKEAAAFPERMDMISLTPAHRHKNSTMQTFSLVFVTYT